MTATPQRKLLNILQELGFSMSESKVIIVLSYLGEATVSQIYEETKLDRAEIYRTLSKLVSKGIIEIILSFPKKFKLLPLSDILRSKFREEEDRFRKLAENLSNILMNFASVHKVVNDVHEVDELRFIVGGDNLIKLQYKLLSNCKHKVRSVLDSYGPYRTLTCTKKVIVEAIKRGVNVRYLLPVNQTNLEQIKELTSLGIQVRHIEDVKSRIVIIDDYDTLLITSYNFTPRFWKEDKGLWIRNKILTQTLVQMYDFIWNRAKEPFN